MRIDLQPATKSHPWIKWIMSRHYSQPRGFVGRQLLHAVFVDKICYGAIAAGSSTKFLPGRDSFHAAKGDYRSIANSIVNCTFFHVFPAIGEYPCRNFTSRVVTAWRRLVEWEWYERYDDPVLGWETLVELPRNGELFLRDGWTVVGQTKGFTCKRVAGKGTDSWTGARKWDTKNLRPKLVLCRALLPR